LGHNDFAPDYLATHYMGLHVTLTGIRGLFAPFVGVLFYHWLELIQPGYGRHALLLPLALAMLGAAGFVLMWRNLAEVGRQEPIEDMD
ncbi:MAG: hypothetical protein ACR2P6_08115, partial [Gammaproteobacteria bacterium]